jgi:glycosyltransferase involved in cell wall biosynthesis
VSRRPVVCFFPARNEAATVAAVVRRAPAAVAGHPVVALVVDDGSTDDTAARARRAGVSVVSLAPGRGLGAAVQRGLEAAVALDAVAVAFADADGEYAPEELERLVAPIVHGHADYVVGSRFAPRHQPMRVHRRAGNLLLTRAMRALTGLPITDGQSGYRALSGAAAAHAEIAHDYNYAQVLTLDLVAKGFRYEEVPISYAPRAHGRSFVRIVPYLWHVVPAVWRVRARGRRLATAWKPAPASVFDDVLAEPVARI